MCVHMCFKWSVTPTVGDSHSLCTIVPIQVIGFDGCWIIEIHCVCGDVAADLSIDRRGEGARDAGWRKRDRGEIWLSSLSFLTWRGRLLGHPFSSKWREHTHTQRYTQHIRDSVWWQSSQTMSISMICTHQAGHPH